MEVRNEIFELTLAEALQRGSKSFLSKKQQKEFAAWVVEHYERFEVTNWENITNHAEEVFSWQLKQPWISNFVRNSTLPCTW